MTTFKNFLLLLCISISLQAYAQEKVTTREVLSLDKGWSFHKGDIPYPAIKGAGHADGEEYPNLNLRQSLGNCIG